VGIAAGGAGGVSINVALAAVAATNITGSTIEASIKGGSDVDAMHGTNGAVTVSATDVSSIRAILVSASISAGGAAGASFNVAGAFTYASNAISSSTDFDWNGDGVIDFDDIHAGVVILNRLNALQAGPDGYIGDLPGDDNELGTADDLQTGDDDLTTDQAIDALGGLDVFANGQPDAAWRAALKARIGSSFDVNDDGGISYLDLLLTGGTGDDVLVGSTQTATISDSTVDTAGAVTVSASTYDDDTLDKMFIESFGVAVGIAAGGAGVASVNVAGAGVVAFNRINNAVEASIKGGSIVDASGDVIVEAEDRAHILSELGAVSLARAAPGRCPSRHRFVPIAENIWGRLLATIDDSESTRLRHGDRRCVAKT